MFLSLTSHLVTKLILVRLDSESKNKVTKQLEASCVFIKIWYREGFPQHNKEAQNHKRFTSLTLKFF